MGAKLDALTKFEWGPQPKAKRRECVTIELLDDGIPMVTLDAADVHGNGRSNKSWWGMWHGVDIDLPNIAAVEAFAKEHKFTVRKLYTR
jgi:hypothetical protein